MDRTGKMPSPYELHFSQYLQKPVKDECHLKSLEEINCKWLSCKYHISEQ